jgi:hypothetical protein
MPLQLPQSAALPGFPSILLAKKHFGKFDQIPVFIIQIPVFSLL